MGLLLIAPSVYAEESSHTVQLLCKDQESMEILGILLENQVDEDQMNDAVAGMEFQGKCLFFPGEVDYTPEEKQNSTELDKLEVWKGTPKDISNKDQKWFILRHQPDGKDG